ADGGHYDSNSATNYIGTYTFTEYPSEGGLPRSFTKRTGDPRINYWNIMGGFYVQADVKVRKNLTITPGLRYEAQTHVPDILNFGPRFGITWAPFKSGKTTLRASAGIFHDWLPQGTYEQT